MKIKDLPKKLKKQELLKRMEVEAMNVHKMADFLGMSSKSTAKYITELREAKKIYIHKYERTIGQFATFYMAGNFPDAPRPLAYTQTKYNRERRRRKIDLVKKHIEQLKAKERASFVPRPDVASAWMFNPC